MSRFVIDETVIEQINFGNEAMASRLRQNRGGGGEIWITSELYRILARVPANERLMNDVGIKAPAQDVPIAREWRQIYSSHQHERTAALALDKRAEVLTTDANFARLFRTQGGTATEVAPLQEFK